MMTIENISLSGFYESIIENAESNILILDAHFTIISLNPGFYWVFLEMYDIHLKKGDNLLDIMRPVMPQVADRWRARCLSAMKGLSINDEEEFEANGQQYFWKVYYKSVTFHNHQCVSIFLRNISANKQFQHKILNHEANLRATINSFKASILFVNQRYELIEYNEHAISHFQNLYNEVLLPSRKFIDMFPAAIHGLRERWFDRLNVACLSLESACYIDNLHLSSRVTICETKINPVLSDGSLAGITISIEDVTQKRMDEQQQKTQLEELMKVNTELDKLLYSASHDLRGPLLSMMGVINLMKRESGQDPVYLNHIESSVKKLDTVVANLINYSKNVQVEIGREEIDFNGLIDSVINHVMHLDGARIIKFSRQINQDSIMISDASRLAVVFQNLLVNACQHIHKWTEPTCSIHITVNCEAATIRIADNGVGIHPNLIGRVFEMFFRASERSNGSGLGLYVVKNMIEKLHGTVAIHSTPGVGTEVVIEIPNMVSQSL